MEYNCCIKLKLGNMLHVVQASWNKSKVSTFSGGGWEPKSWLSWVTMKNPKISNHQLRSPIAAVYSSTLMLILTENKHLASRMLSVCLHITQIKILTYRTLLKSLSQKVFSDAQYCCPISARLVQHSLWSGSSVEQIWLCSSTTGPFGMSSIINFIQIVDWAQMSTAEVWDIQM